jgi:hypothetical protein
VDVPVVGTCDPRFTLVKEEFTRNFAERDEVGAAVCVIVDGAPVVDLAGGWADPDTQTPFGLDTLVDFYAHSSSSRPGWWHSTTRSRASGPSSGPRARRQQHCATPCVIEPRCRRSGNRLRTTTYGTGTA